MVLAEGGLITLDDDYHFFNLRKDLETCPQDMIQRMDQKLREIFEDEQFKFKTMILNIILAHENVSMKKNEEAVNIFEKILLEVETLKEIGCKEPLFQKISNGLLNVIKTCLAYISILQDDNETARKMQSTIIARADLDDSNKAGIYGISSAIFMEYGLSGHKIALENAEKAKETDPTNPYWHFLYGKALGRIRRVETPYMIPSEKERAALKAANMDNNNYLFMLFTAENYTETSLKTYRYHSRNRSLHASLKMSIDQLNEEAASLFKKCIEIQPRCSHVLFRAAKGFLNLPYPQKDPERAKELLLKGLKNNLQNPFANHLLARYYERYNSNIPKAIEHLKICTDQHVFGAEMDFLRLQYSKDQNAKNILDRLQELLNIYLETPRKLQILTQMASYYIFIESDLIKACQFLKDAISMNCEDNILDHRSLFLQNREPFSILAVLIDEMKIQMENKTCDLKTKKIYESFIFDLADSKFPINKGRAKNYKDDLLKENEELRSTTNFQRKYVNLEAGKRDSFIRPNRRSSFSRSGRMSTNGRKVEKAQSVQKVDDFFDSYSCDNSKKELNWRNNGGKNSLNNSYSDLSVANGSRYTSNRGRYNNRRYSKTGNEDELEFDKLSVERPKFRSPREKNEDRTLEQDFDRLSVSSRNSDTQFTGTKSLQGRGRGNGLTNSSFHDRGDSTQTATARGGGRGNFNYTKFGTGRGRPNIPSQSGNGKGQENSSPRQNTNQSPKSPPWRRKTPKENPDTVTKTDSDSDDDLMSYFKKK